MQRCCVWTATPAISTSYIVPHCQVNLTRLQTLMLHDTLPQIHCFSLSFHTLPWQRYEQQIFCRMFTCARITIVTFFYADLFSKAVAKCIRFCYSWMRALTSAVECSPFDNLRFNLRCFLFNFILSFHCFNSLTFVAVTGWTLRSELIACVLHWLNSLKCNRHVRDSPAAQSESHTWPLFG